MDSNGLPLFENLVLQPFRTQGTPVSGEFEPGAKESANVSLPLRDEARLQEPIHWRDLEVMREIVNMNSQRDINRSVLKLDIEITKWRGVGGHRTRHKHR